MADIDEKNKAKEYYKTSNKLANKVAKDSRGLVDNIMAGKTINLDELIKS